LDALLPGALLRRGYKHSGAVNVVYLSEAARQRYGACGLPRGRLLPPQVDVAGLPPPAVPADTPRIVFLGPALALRGAWLAVEAFETAIAQGLDAELLLLLRPDSGRASLVRLLGRVRRSPARARIRCSTRMLRPDELAARLSTCHVFLLPFKVPVSEVPLVVLEAGLSGRALVVLDAPGVSEYARRFGGHVATTARELPGLLHLACARPPTRLPDATPWTRWDRAMAGVLAGPDSSLERLRFIGLIGVDGSGKTFLLGHLARQLDALNVPHRQVWSRFRNYLSKPLLALTRLTGHNVKVEEAGVRIGYHNFHQSRALGLLFVALQAIDQTLDILGRYRLRGRPRLTIGDRCIFDTLVDLAIDTGLDDLIIDRLGPRLVRLLPAPRLVVLIDRPVALVRASRPDVLLDRNFARRRALYVRLAARFGIPVIENSGSPEAAIAGIMRLARCPPADAGGTS
jgi:thymidylate kinase